MADSAGSLRNRAIILVLYSSGLRNSTLRALLYRDVSQEMTQGKANIRLPVYPEMKLVDYDACKYDIPYFSFTCDEGTDALSLYLKDRAERYSALAGPEPLFATEYNQLPREDRTKTILSRRELQMVVKLAAKRAGLHQWESVHPHCLRKAFETVLHSQLIDGSNLDVKIQEFFMGHILPDSQDPYFDWSKVELFRTHYSKLKFGRAAVENKFRVLEAAVGRAFEGTGIDPGQVMQEYVRMRTINRASVPVD
jgi:integrase